MHIKRCVPFFLLLALSATFLSCYRMPTEDDCSLIPMTNNPSVTRQRDDSLTPKVAY